MQEITSSRNPLIKEIKALKTRKYRDEKRLFFIEGYKFVQEALEERVEFTAVLMSEGFAASSKGSELLPQLEQLSRQQFSCFRLPDRLFGEISETDTPQGVLGVVRMQRHTLDEVMEGNRLFIILDSLQDPGNMGTIIRTADAAGFAAVIALKGCVDAYNPKVLRSTMGSVFHIPVISTEDAARCFQRLKSGNVRIYAAHLEGTVDYFRVDMKRHTALVIGNESNGISDEIAALAHERVRIPMPGRSESLNASVAAGLLMYESVRQRMSG